MAGDELDPEAFLATARAGNESGKLDLNESIAPDISQPGRVLARLNELAAGGSSLESKLVFRETLGAGGMGLVRVAEQRSMARPVAVKSVREDMRSDTAAAGLLREAWVTGSLEHPNVVPVYDVGVDESGHPLVMLKRIEGIEWAELIHEPSLIEERFSSRDALGWNLALLLQVIDALRFAHSRGVIHRDLKPSNVMIGEFGEVYLLDWGIAVRLPRDADGNLEASVSHVEPAGTPAYMAPEMLGQSEISIRTDIYLVGGLLYEIIAGKAPHEATSVTAAIDSIKTSNPEMPNTAPAELADICRRAMAPVPEQRHESLDQLQGELRAFLEHRSSMTLCSRAQDRLANLGKQIESLREQDTLKEAAAQGLYNTFSECRFAFREALSSWPGNQAARRGLDEALTLMIQLELELDEPRAAKNLLSELDAPPPQLEEQVNRAFDAKQDRLQHLQHLGRFHDVDAGWRTRSFAIIVLGTIWAAFPLVGAYNRWQTKFSHFHVSLMTLGLLATSLALFYWARESLLKSALNRRLIASAIFVSPAQIALLAGAALLEISMPSTLALSMLLWSVIAGMVALTTSSRLLLATFGYLAGFFVAALRPDLVLYAMSASNLVMAINVLSYSLALRRETGE